MDLLNGKCTRIDAGIPPLTRKEINGLLRETPGWSLENGHLYRRFLFRDFGESLRFINGAADIALGEMHFPDACIIQSRYVDILLYTSVIGGLSMNDFILAAKINQKLVSGSDRSGF